MQVSWTSHLVPRIVAALYWPRVRNLPLPSPQSLRVFGFVARRERARLRAAELLSERQRGDAAGLAELEQAVVELRDAAVGARDLDDALARIDLGAVLDHRRVERDELAAAGEPDEDLAAEDAGHDALARDGGPPKDRLTLSTYPSL